MRKLRLERVQMQRLNEETACCEPLIARARQGVDDSAVMRRIDSMRDTLLGRK